MESTKIWYLKRINLFRCLAEDELERVEALAPPRLYQRRQLIFGPEDPGDSVYLVETGRVRLSRFDQEGREITLAILEEGEFFGEEALAEVDRHEGFAEALDETRIRRIDGEEFERLLADNADLALTVARQVSERLLGAPSRLEELAFPDPSSRLAGALLELARRYGETAEDGSTRIAQRVTRQELAALIASAREATTALLGEFQREGWIGTDGRSILLTDRSALESLARHR